jgi:hypothetical protein
MLGFVTASNLAVTIAWWTGASFTALSLFCVAVMFSLRSRTAAARKRRAAVIEKWEETLFRATDISPPDDFSGTAGADAEAAANPLGELGRALGKKELPDFLYEWNYLHESLAGDSKKGLNFLADALELNEMTLELLKSPFLDKRILAINTLGNLGQENAYAELEKLLDRRDPIISSWAWRALFRINTAATIEKHLGLIAAREDWSPIFVAKVLQEIESDTISEPLCRLVAENYGRGLEERQMSRLISYLILAHVADYQQLVNRILLETDEMEVLIACLRLVNSDDDLTRIRALIRDERWEVRMQVVLTLGRLGHEEDLELLLGALEDPDWWVRYRTASVLFSMPGMTAERLEGLAESLPNRFARDILRQVLTEMRLLCYSQSTLTLSR